MADGTPRLTRLDGAPAPRPLALRLRVQWRLTPVWIRVLLIYAASRVVSTIVLLSFARGQDYFTFATIWDGQWYWFINSFGYPSELPLDDQGNVRQNQWAFLPAYPILLRAFTTLGLPFPIIAPIVSMLFGAGAALLFHRMLSRFLGSSSALFAVVLFCTAPLSPILQVSYAESMGLFLLFAALNLLLDRRYWLLIPVVIVMSLTRPSGLAFALLLLLHLIHRWVVRRRDPFPLREQLAVIVAGLASALSGMLWPLIAWVATGSPTAYTDTELAWRAGYVGHQELLPFAPWFESAAFWLRFAGLPASTATGVGAVLVAVVLGTFALFLVTPWARRLGVDLRLWLASYVVYLVAVFFPQSSTFRLLLPLAPALGAFAVPRSVAYRVSLVALGIVGQVWWVHIAWWVNGVDWSPP